MECQDFVNSSSSSISVDMDTNRDAPSLDNRDYINYDALDELTRPFTGNRRKKNKRNHTAVPKINYGATDYLAQKITDYRYTLYSSSSSTLHCQDLYELAPLLKDELNNTSCFWIDIQSPTELEMKQLSTLFNIHPLTEEDIATEEPREKCEAFHHYYFICFRSFEADPYSICYLQPIGFYILIFKHFVLTFHSGPLSHPSNVRKRILHLDSYLKVTPDWICYGLLDDITDSFAPLIRAIEFEVDSIDELVLILKESEQSDMLRRIGYCRKKMMSLLRLLVTKSDVIKRLTKRGEHSENGNRPVITSDVIIYLGDVQDHLVTMLQSLNHYEKISSRSHSNYLAQISIEMTQTNNEINDVLSKMTALGSVVIPMNLVTGLWGMNVQVPGQFQEDLKWFFAILACIFTFCIISGTMMKTYKII
ncbi:cora-domain-containing protein [Backusella circina FSU 941]|nr:cora-domain-containing protein [Backusella circina FSU 941]